MTRDIVVIGGSAGALGPLRSILHDVASDLPAAVFVVLHRGSHSHDSLVELLSLGSSLPVKAAKDGDPIVPGTVCIAPPDEHLVVKADRLKLTRGPRENQWRPAIDVLFRSAAVACGARVTGVILSGALDDGSAGLSAIKRCGGVAIAQAPGDALVSDMPSAAIRATEVDYVVSAEKIAGVIGGIVARPAESVAIPEDLILEAQIAETGRSSAELQNRLGDLSPFSCPDCGGPLWKQRSDAMRYRCLAGHGLSTNSLEQGLTRSLDQALWAAIRQFEQRARLLQDMAEDQEHRGRHHGMASYRDRAAEARSHAEVLRQLLYKGLNRNSDAAA